MKSYPKPGPTGGTLIRSVISLFKSQGFVTPLRGPICFAVSGGVDSMVLAHLLVRYGRNLISSDQVTLLHFDHGWRPESGSVEGRSVLELSEQLGVAFRQEKLTPPTRTALSSNWEEDARLKRLNVFDRIAGPGKEFEWVLTAHHQDDVAETVLWRFLRGEFSEGEVGIKFLDSPCLRPFLEVNKAQILEYAREEKLNYHEDPTNQDVRRFRAWARAEVFPMLEKAFPSVKKTLSGYANHLGERASPPPSSSGNDLVNLLQAIVDAPLNRVQRTALSRILKETPSGQGLSLPNGVQLKRLKTGWFIEQSNQDNQA